MAAKYINAKERHLFIENMMSKLSYLSIEEIVSLRIPLKPHGSALFGACPFHGGTANSSFKVVPSKGIWKCFKCGDGYGGNGIKFISLYDGIDYLQAAFKIALEKNIISNEEYSLYAEKQNYSKEYVNTIKRAYNNEKMKSFSYSPKARFDVCHNVYRTMKECCELSDVHFRHLKNKRKLSEERINADYFTFPTTETQKRQIIKKIQEDYPEYIDEVLMLVPGFYFDKKMGHLTFYSVNGIGMLIHDAYGHIAAIQIRKDTKKEGQKRYIWFSSSFTVDKPDLYLGGASCGSPRDILYPDNTERSILCITEGRFKSEILCSAGNLAVSLQGVSSWKGLDKDIIEIMKDRTAPIKSFFIFFDADMFGKWEVFKQLVSLSDMLSSVFPFTNIKCACWHEADGKGIDDVFLNGKINDISYIDISYIQKIYYDILNNLLESLGYKSIRDIPQDSVKYFRECLQEKEEKAILG